MSTHPETAAKLKFSIVTPSYNQGRFLETCIRSVLDQEYPNLEYFVMDGGSSDQSKEIIERYADRLSGWRSRPDGGHMDAVQDGFDRSTGEIMGWLNSDDKHAPWALAAAAAVFRQFPDVQWITSMFPMLMDEDGMVFAARRVEGFNPEAFYRGRNVPFNPWFYSSFIQQESTFWRRSLWEKAGGKVDKSLRVAGDFELWSRFFEHAELFTLGVPLGIFRFQKQSFTSNEFDAYKDVCRGVLGRFGRRPPSRLESLARRLARSLPEGARPRTGLGYPVRHIVRDAEAEQFIQRQTWIL